MGSAKQPLRRTIPIPLSPNGVEMAAIVSSSLGGILFEELNEDLLFTLILRRRQPPLFRMGSRAPLSINPDKPRALDWGKSKG